MIASPAVAHSTVSQTLASAAFGADPGRWPLPVASTPREQWWRAVAAGGQGRYGSAQGELAALRRTVGPLASLAHSTQGSLLRQLGWHEEARRWDGRAVLLAGDDAEARVDALVGLAADALGVGRFAVSAKLLERARGTLAAAADPPHRLAIRVQWVGAELAMATGDGPTAVSHATRAVEFAESGSSLRHRVKSQVVSAAALCCSGRVDEARTVADAALQVTASLGLEPLRWALASLLVGIGSASHSAVEVRDIRDVAAGVVRHRGGVWRK